MAVLALGCALLAAGPASAQRGGNTLLTGPGAITLFPDNSSGGAVGGSTGSTGGAATPAWAVPPPTLAPPTVAPQPPPLTEAEVLSLLAARGYYDVQRLRLTEGNYTAVAHFYGKPVSVTVDPRTGYITRNGTDSAVQSADGD